MRAIFIPGMARTGSDAEGLLPHLPNNLQLVVAERPGAARREKKLPDTHFRHDLAVKTILELAGEEQVILVAHSFGGYLAEMAGRQLQQRRPGQLRGIVFLDSSTPQVPRPLLNPRTLWELWRPAIWLFDSLAQWLFHDHKVSTAFKTVAMALQENAAFRSTARAVRISRTEKPAALAGVPVIVVTALGHLGWRLKGLPGSWFHRQARMAKHLDGRHLVIHPSGHHVMVEHPKEVADIIATLL